MFRDYQITLENTANLNRSLQVGRYSKCLGRGQNHIWGLDNPLETMYFHMNKKDANAVHAVVTINY